MGFPAVDQRCMCELPIRCHALILPRIFPISKSHHFLKSFLEINNRFFKVELNSDSSIHWIKNVQNTSVFIQWTMFSISIDQYKSRKTAITIKVNRYRQSFQILCFCFIGAFVYYANQFNAKLLRFILLWPLYCYSNGFPCHCVNSSVKSAVNSMLVRRAEVLTPKSFRKSFRESFPLSSFQPMKLLK